MKKTKVFIPVDENDENMCGAFNSIDGRGGCYVKEQEGYFFTTEEIKEIITNAFVAGINYTMNNSDMAEEEYIKSLNIK